ncbi:porin family protein [Dyadobacter sp. 3J3]|uniref:porin family protein n=1 Tax=Dyadobacter sp. 3J3 TaxID=2606600 RepID=UPI001E45858F|nr:porin family protein [Dyadobacter sp. 3J3]
MKPLTNTVKNLILSTLISLSISGRTFSQTTRFTLLINNVNANFNYGKSNSTLHPYKKNFKGLQLGASFQAGITPHFSVLTELYFVTKGGSLKENNPVTFDKTKLRLNTLELPTLARVHFGRIYINSGPYVAYNLSGRLKIDGSPNSSEKAKSISFQNTPDGFRRWDFGVQAGAGYIFPFKKASIVLDVRYGHGLTNISRGIERYNRVLNISVLVSKPWKKNPFSKQG